ncbi:MAG: AMIN-like domain-containing (lipo)protein [Actinomycetota bacterium]
MKRLLVAMVVGALALTACAQRESGLGASVSLGSEGVAEKPDSGKSQKKASPKARNAGKKGTKVPAPIATGESQQATECSPATGGGDHLAQLTAVRVGTHPGCDRVAFEFAPPENGPRAFGVPRYQVIRMSPPITEDGSGRPVAVDGTYHAGIVFHGGTGVDLTTSDPKGYKVTYTGPARSSRGSGFWPRRSRRETSRPRCRGRSA